MITVDLPERNAAADTVNQCVSALRSFLMRAQKAVPISGTVSVLLTTDSTIRKLNHHFRGLNHATDVLSFPAAVFLEKSGGLQAAKRDSPARVAGDLAISVDTAARQAKKFGHPLQVELKILLLHGLLHLAGHDHEKDSGEMTALEETLRRRFRLPPALIARTMRDEPASRA